MACWHWALCYQSTVVTPKIHTQRKNILWRWGTAVPTHATVLAYPGPPGTDYRVQPWLESERREKSGQKMNGGRLQEELSNKGRKRYSLGFMPKMAVCSESPTLVCLFLPPNMQNKLTCSKNSRVLSPLRGKHDLRKDWSIFFSS